MSRPSDLPTGPVSVSYLGGPGEMAERTRLFDWAAGPLGPIERWPQSLKIAVRIMLDSRYAMWLGWGPDLVFFYNDAYAQMTLGPKHPWALGRSTREVWSEIWEDIGPRAESVIRTGQATWDEGLLLFLERRGFPEETYHTFSYSPVPDDSGGVGGMLCVVTEDTRRTIGERRLRTLRELGARMTDQPASAEEACQVAAGILTDNDRDVPFVMIYLVDEGGAHLAGMAGLPTESPAAPRRIPIDDGGSDHSGWPLHRVATSGDLEVVPDLAARFGSLAAGPWPEPVSSAVVLPVAGSGQDRPAGFVVAGISARLTFDDEYRGFLELAASQVATAVTNARAYQEERRRAEALTELDRAKTAFFSNVSHEFRTPLTLMLGPVEDLLTRDPDEMSSTVRSELEVVNRNGMRLLRLVNSLLDFSRIEAGRIRAVYQPTDLAGFTAELASVFRSACERAGLRLVVDCPPLGEPVVVDREMWEKIVLNLLSNAFKFTFEGEIVVSLGRVGSRVELRVRDTGTGIPADEMPRLFERFHRIDNARGRTHEGSGIGLALVQELVKLHDGTVSAESGWGRGTTFMVSIPFGADRLDTAGPAQPSTRAAATAALPFVEEALRWLPTEKEPLAESSTTAPVTTLGGQSGWLDEDDRPRVLIADDNADMRQYLARLLAEAFSVEVVPDGGAALARIRANPPELVLTDVMMPRLDGFGLLRALRADPRTSGLPVIMLSARAGEESRVEGLERGADDYLVKPFSARELLARVTAHIQMARMRRESSQALRESHDRFAALINAAPLGIYLVDEELRIRHINPKALPAFGGLPDLIGRSLLEVFEARVPPADAAELVAQFRETLATGEPYYVAEREARRLDRDAVEYYEWQLHRIALPEGQFGVVCYFSDISHHVRARQTLAEKERRLREAEQSARETLESISDGFFAVGADWTFRYVNTRAEMLLQRKPGELLGRSLWDEFPGLVGSEFERIYREVVRNREPASLTGFYPEHERWYETHAYPAIEGMSVYFRDVTPRILAEAEVNRLVAASEQQRRVYETALSNNADFIYTFDLAGRFTFVNRALLELWGKDAAEAVGKNFHDLEYPPALAARLQGQIQTVIETKQALTDETPFTSAAGERHYEYIFVPVFGPEGEVTAVAGSTRDITERKRSEEILRQRAEEIQTLLDTLPIGVFIAHDAECRVITGNLAAHQLLRTPAANLSKSASDADRPAHFRVFRNGKEVPDHELPVQRAAAGEQVRNEEVDDVFDDGTVIHTIISAAPLFDGQGRARGAVATVLDVTDRKRAETALLEADRRKNEFLATLAHELRNPLAPLQNGLQLMRIAGAGSPVGETARTMMERQLAQLVRLVDDLLDISRITQGKLELRKAPVDLTAAINSALEASRPLIEELGHRLEVILPVSPIVVDADLTRLAQVFMNLLNNAAKYTDRGGRIRLEAMTQGSDVVVSVRDTGVGIAADHLDRIFEVFSQVDLSLEASRGGLGIGLSLVKRIVEMHGGGVEARSDGRGRGSEFVVRLPILHQIAPAKAPRRPEDGRMEASLRVLIVDDNTDSADSLGMMLRIMGNETRTAYDGEAALNVVTEFKPDVVLLDLGMPKLNGYEACRRIRAGAGGAGIVIIAQTGWGQEGDRQRTHEAGFDYHMVKPIDPAELMKLLAGLSQVARG